MYVCMYSGMYYYCVHISSHSTTVDSAAICYLDAASNQVMSSQLHHSEELDLSGNALSDHAACQSSIWQNPAASDSGNPKSYRVSGGSSSWMVHGWL